MQGLKKSVLEQLQPGGSPREIARQIAVSRDALELIREVSNLRSSESQDDFRGIHGFASHQVPALCFIGPYATPAFEIYADNDNAAPITRDIEHQCCCFILNMADGLCHTVLCCRQLRAQTIPRRCLPSPTLQPHAEPHHPPESFWRLLLVSSTRTR